MMDVDAAALANRTDCGWADPLNYDALLLGGFYCHTCLPDPCPHGGTCSNVQWRGYTCDNSASVTVQRAATAPVLKLVQASRSASAAAGGVLELQRGMTHRIVVDTAPLGALYLADADAARTAGPHGAGCGGGRLVAAQQGAFRGSSGSNSSGLHVESGTGDVGVLLLRPDDDTPDEMLLLCEDSRSNGVRVRVLPARGVPVAAVKYASTPESCPLAIATDGTPTRLAMGAGSGAAGLHSSPQGLALALVLSLALLLASGN